MNQTIDLSEYYGLNPNRAYYYLEAIERKSEFLSNVIAAFISIATLRPVFFCHRDYYKVVEYYKEEASKISEKRSWLGTRVFSLSELKEMKGSKELTDYLKETGGNARIQTIPSKEKIVAPSGGKMKFITGGILSRMVEIDFNLSFYTEDGKNNRGYFGLDPKLVDAWPHLIAAGEHKEAVDLGVQLDREYDFVKNSYFVKHMSFPEEKVIFGPETYQVFSEQTIKELAEKPIKQVRKDRIFRAAVELGYVF